MRVSECTTASNVLRFYSDNISVDKRIHYLSHSLVCMKSDQSGAAPHVGILYQEVEDTLQVAQIQLKVGVGSEEYVLRSQSPY